MNPITHPRPCLICHDAHRTATHPMGSADLLSREARIEMTRLAYGAYLVLCGFRGR